jgi:small subunit ribosomal protein S8
VDIPTSRMKVGIAKLMLEQGYISGYDVKAGEHGDVLVVHLKYGKNRERVISGIKRVSKPGKRIYARKETLPKVLGGLGTAVISTSRGLVTSAEAQRLGLGGEVICFIW